MAFSYRWADLLDLVKRQVKNIPTDTVDVIQCDAVSSRIAGRLPWKQLQQTIADGQIPLIDGQQDYDPPFNIWRLIDASLQCVSIDPPDNLTIAVRQSLPIDLRRRAPYAITSVALQAAEGKLRLSSAVNIPENQAWELRGQYQINTKVTSLSQNLWFDDRYVHVGLSALLYWYYVLADDPRAGSTSGNWPGDITYTGQLAQFMSGIKEMTDAEDIGGDMQTMPDAPLGIASRQYGAMIAGYGFFGGGGTAAGNGQSRGIVALNGDTSPTQSLVGGYGISVTSSGIGSLLISYTGSSNGGGGGGGIASINLSTVGAQQIVGSGAVLVSTNVATGVTTISITSVLSALTVSPAAVVGGSANATGTVTLSFPAPAGGAVVTLSSSNSAVASVPASVTVAANQTTATFTVTSHAVAANTPVTITGNYNGAQTANLQVNAPAPVQRIYAGVGAPGATSTVTPGSGNTVVLSTGDSLAQAKTTPEVAGDSFGPFSPNNQCVYMLLFGGSHTFVDANTGLAFVCNAPLVVNLSGVSMFLYQSTNTLFGTSKPKIAS